MLSAILKYCKSMVLNSQHTCISFFLHSFLCFFLYCLFIGDEYLLWCLIQSSHLTIPSAWIIGVNYHTWILHLFLVTFPLLLDSVSHYYVLHSSWTNVEPMCTVFTVTHMSILAFTIAWPLHSDSLRDSSSSEIPGW